MRLFIGIKPDDSVLEQIDRFLKPFKKIASPVNWTELKNIHITLKFIGEVSDAQYALISKKIRETDFHVGAVKLVFTGCGKFGRDSGMDIFWVGLAPDKNLEEIYQRLENSLARIGFPREKRPFSPHVTVARNKKVFNFKSFFVLMEERRETEIARCEAARFQLFQSRLTPEGPVYSVLEEVDIVAG